MCGHVCVYVCVRVYVCVVCMYSTFLSWRLHVQFIFCDVHTSSTCKDGSPANSGSEGPISKDWATVKLI